MSKKSVFDVSCLGTSLTGGRYSQDWVRMLEVLLSQTADRPVRTYDFGIGSSTSANNGLVNAQRVAGLKAKCVTIEFDINDSVTANAISQAQSHANYTSIVNTIRNEYPDAKIFLMSMNPLSEAGVAGGLRPQLEDRYAALPGLATSLGCEFINNRALFGTYLTAGQSSDGLHLNATTVKSLLLPNIYAALLPFLSSIP